MPDTAISEDVIRQFAARAHGLQALDPAERARELDNLANWFKEQPVLRDALANRKATMDAELAGRQASRREANTIATLMDPAGTAKTPGPPSPFAGQQRGVSKVVSELNKAGGTPLTL